MGIWFAIGLVALVIGIVFGLVGLIPPLRRAARANRTVRVGTAIGAALIAFLVMDAIVSLITANAAVVFGLYDGAPMESLGGALVDRDAVQRELWFRDFNPLPGPACYTTASACAWAEYVLHGPEGAPPRPVDMGAKVALWLIKLLPGAIALGTALRATRPEASPAVTPAPG